jgi:hypothetical protein
VRDLAPLGFDDWRNFAGFTVSLGFRVCCSGLKNQHCEPSSSLFDCIPEPSLSLKSKTSKGIMFLWLLLLLRRLSTEIRRS